MQILNYGGGRQTVAIIVLILRGLLPKPDRIISANTGRENPTTWEYLNRHVQPALAVVGLEVEVIPPRTVYDLWSGNGNTCLIPAWTIDAKLSAFCSGTWKRDRMDAYLSDQGVRSGVRWIGFATDERKRINRLANSDRNTNWTYRFPLTEFAIDSNAACALVESYGWPVPSISSCWMCPNKKNAEWRCIRENYPRLFEDACRMDEEIREEDIAKGNSGLWLHHSRQPLSIADLDADDRTAGDRQCSLGMCFV